MEIVDSILEYSFPIELDQKIDGIWEPKNNFKLPLCVPVGHWEEFEDVAGNRVQMVLEKLENLSKCSNKRNYEFSEKDIDKMFRAINQAVRNTKLMFESELSSNNKEKKTFKF